MTRPSVKSGIINQTLPSAPHGKLRWMPKMWLHHHIDSERKCGFGFAVSGLKTAACHLLEAPSPPPPPLLFPSLSSFPPSPLPPPPPPHPFFFTASYYTGTSIPLPVNYAKGVNFKKKSQKALLLPSWPRSCATSLLSSSSSSLPLRYHKQQRHGQRGGGGESSLDRGLCEHDGPDSRE